jgi:hypothetical protein
MEEEQVLILKLLAGMVVAVVAAYKMLVLDGDLVAMEDNLDEAVVLLDLAQVLIQEQVAVVKVTLRMLQAVQAVVA